MNNIYIVGVPRSGKTTLARLLKAKLPEVNVISFEAVRNGFLKAQPELDMGNRKSAARREILPQFMVEFANWNRRMSGCTSVVEGSFASVAELVRLTDKDDRVVCLGFGSKKLAEAVALIKQHESNNDYTRGHTEAEIAKHFYDLAEDDARNLLECKECGVRYFDTSEKRDEVLTGILDSVLL